MVARNIGQSGQSGQEFVNQDTSWSGFAMLTYGIPVLQTLVDPAQADTVASTFYINEGTAIGGIGVVFDSGMALTLAGDNYYGTASGDYFVRCSSPNLPTWDDWTTWPLTNRGNDLVAAYSGASAPDKTAIQAINWFQNEYDAAGYPLNYTWAGVNPEIWAKGVMRLVTAVRAAVGKTAAQLPVLFATPFPYSPATNAGTEAIYNAQQILLNTGGFNARRWGGNLMDCVWDRNDGFGGNNGNLQFHPNQGDQILVSRRAGYAQARLLGPVWTPTTNIIYAGRGPRATYAQYINSTTFDVFIEHDGGTDISLPTQPTMGWRVTYAGAVLTVSSVTRMDAQRVRLVVNTACPYPSGVRVFYTFGAGRIIPTPAITGSQGSGAIYDNASAQSSRIIPAALTGPARLNFPLHRTPVGGLIPSPDAPSKRYVMPL